MDRRNATRLRGEHTQRERVWLVIQRLISDGPRFSGKDVHEQADAHKTTVVKTIQLLRQNGLVETVSRDKDGHFAVYRLLDCPDGFPDCISTRVLAWRQQVWNALRIQGMTTVPSIKSTFHEVDPAEDTVYRYLRRLERAGYVARAGRSGPKGQVMSHLRWRLVTDTGPTAPGRKQLEQKIEESDD